MLIHKLQCSIPYSSISYDILVHNGALNDKEALKEHFGTLNSTCVIITNDDVLMMHGKSLAASLSDIGLETHLLSFPAGEKHKTRTTKEDLENRMLEKGLGKDTCVIALGGGVVTDMAGYVAATYCRGVPLITIPTSLLGMVDAAIGGKNGVNTSFGKNMLGSIYQPKMVLIDPSVLKSLPLQEMKNGFVEMIKHGLIDDAEYFCFLKDFSKKLLAHDSKTLAKAIVESCRIKTGIVSEDEQGNGKRHLLNFGHTIAHALEGLSHYSMPHGEAVAVGILVESHIAKELGHLNQEVFDQIRETLVKFELPLQLPFQPDQKNILTMMSLDKKSLRGCPRFVLINEIGSPVVQKGSFCAPVEEAIIKNSLDWLCNDLCRH